MSDKKVTCFKCLGAGKPFDGGFFSCCGDCNGHGYLIEKTRWSLSKRRWASDYERLNKKVGILRL